VRVKRRAVLIVLDDNISSTNRVGKWSAGIWGREQKDGHSMRT